MSASATDRDLVQRIRRGDERAWQEFIRAYEGRLLAFGRSRLRDHALAEDLVQETFLGFLTALPHFDEQTPIEVFLFAIMANKITDSLRKAGRRPTLPLNADDAEGASLEPVSPERMASSLARSREQRGREDAVIAECLSDILKQCRTKCDFERIKCVELLFVRGLTNKGVAEALGLSEQAVANHKHFVVSKLKDAARAAGLSLAPAALGLND